MDIRRASAGTLANSLRSEKVASFDEGLWQDCLDWTAKRNKHAHHMANISEPSPTKWRVRIREAKAVAEAGFALVNRVTKESKQHKL